MLARSWKLGLLGALIMGSLAVTGCLRSMQVYTIYPDGSGKAEIKMTLLGMMAQAAKMGAQGQGPEAQDPVEQIKSTLSGKVFWKDLKGEDGEAGSYVISGTAYFEDVNQIQPDKGSIKFAPEGEGYRLTIEQESQMPGGLPGMEGGDEGSMSPEQKAQAEQMKTMIKGMLAGFEMQMRVNMPGAVTSIDGFTEQDGRSAWLKLDEQALVKMIDSNAKPPETMTAACGAPGAELQAEWDSFKKELAEAKAAAAEEEKDGGAAPKQEPGSGEGQF